MPPVNHAAVSAGVVALGVAVAAAIAIYENPELRRMADDIRRRIALALHSLGDGVNPANREPMFNRPEDAEGFLQSRGVVLDPNADVTADEETRRRQREELLYWNSIHLEKKEREQREKEEAASTQTGSQRGSSFDDFLREDASAEKGTFVFNTGADIGVRDEGLVRRRGTDGVRGLHASMYANPFADENHIDHDEHLEMETGIMSPTHDEVMSDCYNATEPETPAQPASRTLSPCPVPASLGEVLFDVDRPETRSDGARLVERELSDDEYMTAGQDYPREDHQEAYASIQAWAQSSQPGFYSPLPVSPPAPLSEPEIISQGALTPTDSASWAGSGEDIGNDTASEKPDAEGRYYDVMSEDSDGIPTPTSWSEVGSVVSESDAGAVRA